MAEYLIQEETLQGIGDKIRVLSGSTDTMTTDEMISVLGQIDRVDQATPSISIDSNGLIIASATQSEGYVEAGTKSATKQLTVQAAKTVTPTTSEQTIVSSGKFVTGDIKVAAMPTATQATPSITVSSAGLVTASATQSAGYVSEGTKSATKQLTVQAAKTVTPKSSAQTAVASGVYTTGAVTVAGDANLVAANILAGKTIFGVAGSAPKVITSSTEVTEGATSSYPEGSVYVVV